VSWTVFEIDHFKVIKEILKIAYSAIAPEKVVEILD
jgi:hypothetical protein